MCVLWPVWTGYIISINSYFILGEISSMYQHGNNFQEVAIEERNLKNNMYLIPSVFSSQSRLYRYMPRVRSEKFTANCKCQFFWSGVWDGGVKERRGSYDLYECKSCIFFPTRTQKCMEANSVKVFRYQATRLLRSINLRQREVQTPRRVDSVSSAQPVSSKGRAPELRNKAPKPKSNQQWADL